MNAFEPSLILTIRIDEQAQHFFNALRQQHFPPERNFLQAHLTLFHKPPSDPETFKILSQTKPNCFSMEVTGLTGLGSGVAYKIHSQELNSLREQLRMRFYPYLNAQDKQGFRPHITVQNKVNADTARILLRKLTSEFRPFMVQAVGLDLWHYLGGPWKHAAYYPAVDL